MQIELKRILEDEKLTQARLRDMRHDEIITARCAPDAAAWKTAERTAYNAKSNYTRSDGFQYVIASSAVEMSVTVSLTK